MAKPSIGTIKSGSVNGTGQGSSSTPLDIPSVAISGSERYLLVGVGFNDDNNETVSSVTIDPGGGNETALAAIAGTIGDIQDDGYTQLWGVKAPPSGTFTVRVIISAGLRSTGHVLGATAWPLTSVDQTTPLGNAGAFAGVSSNPEVTLTSDADEIVFGCVFVEDQSSMSINTPGVEDAKLTPAHDTFASGHEDGAASVTIDWTCPSDKVAASAVAVNGSAGAGPQTVTPSAIAAAFSAAVPSLVPGVVSLTPSAVTASLAAAIPVLNSVYTATPSAVSSAFSLASATLVPGTASLMPAPASAVFSSVTPVVNPGAATLSPSALTSTFSIALPAVASGNTLTPGAVAAAFALITPSLAKGPVTLSPSAVLSSFVVASPNLTGLAVLTPDALSAAFSTASPLLVAGVATLIPGPVSANFAVSTVTLASPLSAAPSAVLATFALPAPLIPTGVTLTPAAASALFALPVTTISGLRTLLPSTLSAVFSTPVPLVFTVDNVTLLPVAVLARLLIAQPELKGLATLLPDVVVFNASIPSPLIGIYLPVPGLQNKLEKLLLTLEDTRTKINIPLEQRVNKLVLAMRRLVVALSETERYDSLTGQHDDDVSF